MITCPKCGYTRQCADTAPDYECPKCSVVYAKARTSAAPAQPPETTPNHGQASTGTSRQPLGLLALAIVVCTIAVLYVTGHWRVPQPTAMAQAVQQPAEIKLHQVVYEVTGTAHAALVTYLNHSGGIEQREVTLPWRTVFGAPTGSTVSVSAQNQSAQGDIKVEIKVSGKTLKSSNSSGGYVIAAADGVI